MLLQISNACWHQTFASVKLLCHFQVPTLFLWLLLDHKEYLDTITNTCYLFDIWLGFSSTFLRPYNILTMKKIWSSHSVHHKNITSATTENHHTFCKAHFVPVWSTQERKMKLSACNHGNQQPIVDQQTLERWSRDEKK